MSFWPTISSTTGRTSEETSLSLVCEENFGSGTLTESTHGQAFFHVVAGRFDLRLFGELGCFDVLVQRARHRRAQPGQVRAAVALRNIVREALHRLLVRVVPLHRDFDDDAVSFRRSRRRWGAARSCCGSCTSTKPLMPPPRTRRISLPCRCADRPARCSRRCSGTTARAGASPGSRSDTRCC